MGSRAILGAVLAGVALTTAPLGVAGSGSVADPRGDLDPSGSSSREDIVRASHGHTRNGRLVHTVTVAGDVGNPASADIPQLWIEDPELPNGTSQCRYFIGRFEGRLGVFTCGYGERVAGARIRRTSSNTVRYEFKPSAIDNPANYNWAFVTKGPVQGTQSFVDRLPDGDHAFLNHRLR